MCEKQETDSGKRAGGADRLFGDTYIAPLFTPD
jgi:hypothetical protein